MPLYNYQAIDRSGKKVTGMIEAHSDKEAKSILRSQGVMVSSIEVKKGGGKDDLQGESLLAFTLQLSQLVNAGIPVYESLLAVEEQYRGEPFHRVILSICEQIKGGSSLSEAMANFPGTFDRLYCSMITAGESVGALGQVLEKLTTLLQKQDKLKKDITTAMIYPMILGGFALFVIILMLMFVVPSIEGIFQGRKLNGFTNFVIGLSHFMQDFWWVYLPLIIGGGTFAYFQLRTEKGKLWLERQLMRLPLISTLMVQAALARFCRTMGTLQQGGLTMIDSLRIAREVMQNRTLEAEIENAEKKIVEGSSLGAELQRSKWIPKLVSRMLKVGEESGTTPIMMNKVAEIYEQELEKTLSRLLAMAQPVIMIFMGGIIGMVLLSILLPLTDMSTFAI